MLLEASIISDTTFKDKPFKISYQLLEALCLTDVSNLKKFFFLYSLPKRLLYLVVSFICLFTDESDVFFDFF